MFKKILALFLFSQLVQAYSCFRLNKIATDFAASNGGVRPVVLPPNKPIDHLLVTYGTRADIDQNKATASYISI